MVAARVTSRDVHAHDLLLGVLVQRVGTELPPGAALLGAAERIRDVDRVPVVHPHAAGLASVRDPMAVSKSFPHTPAERPRSLSLATSAASSTSEYWTTDRTGPKISSRAMRMSLRASTKMAGST